MLIEALRSSTSENTFEESISASANYFNTKVRGGHASVAAHSIHLPQVRAILPYHLTVLARCEREIALDVTSPVTIKSILDALETRFPNLRGTVREHDTLKRRALVRFYACEEDHSHSPTDVPLPDAVAEGREPFIILGAIAGG